VEESQAASAGRPRKARNIWLAIAVDMKISPVG